MAAGGAIALAAATIIVAGSVWIGQRVLATGIFVRHRLRSAAADLRRSVERATRNVDRTVLEIRRIERSIADVRNLSRGTPRHDAYSQIAKDMHGLANCLTSTPTVMQEFSTVRDAFVAKIAVLESRISDPHPPTPHGRSDD